MGVPRTLVDARSPLLLPGASASQQPQTRSRRRPDPETHMQSSSPSRWKGKKRDEGNGGADGVVLSLNLVGDGTYTAYVPPPSFRPSLLLPLYFVSFASVPVCALFLVSWLRNKSDVPWLALSSSAASDRPLSCRGARPCEGKEANQYSALRFCLLLPSSLR